MRKINAKGSDTTGTLDASGIFQEISAKEGGDKQEVPRLEVGTI
jgi:hypothetical protein